MVGRRNVGEDDELHPVRGQACTEGWQKTKPFMHPAGMAVRDSYRDYVMEQLGRVRPVTWRKMFGGVGVYADGRFFALLDNDTLFFKTGDANRADFEARGMKPFQPFGPDSKPMAYHELPGDVLEDVAELAAWMAKAIQVADAKAVKKPVRDEVPGVPAVSGGSKAAAPKPGRDKRNRV